MDSFCGNNHKQSIMKWETRYQNSITCQVSKHERNELQHAKIGLQIFADVTPIKGLALCLSVLPQDN